MAEAATTTTTQDTITTTGTPWHQGKVDADTVGWWQNKGYDLSDPIKLTAKLTEQYRQAESRLGVPADQLLRKLKPDSPEADVKNFWSQLGAPEDPKGYDFSSIKNADGSAALDDKVAETLRESFARRHVPADTALEIAKDFAKFNGANKTEADTIREGKLATERAALQKEWGRDFDANLFIAKQGAKVLGLTGEQATALEGLVGYKAIMTAMHRVGILNKEDRFIVPPPGSDGSLMTREAAAARKTELMNDQAWVGRYMKGDREARATMLNLNRLLTGDFESAA